MIGKILKTAMKAKEDVSELYEKVAKKLDTRQVIENHKALTGKVFEVVVPIYKNAPGQVFSLDNEDLRYPARSMDREAYFEQGSKVKVVHASPHMLFVESV